MRTATKLLIALIALVAIAAIFIVGFASMQHYRRLYPDRAFVQITGRALPADVRVIAYNWTFKDNLVHASHYWLLTGSSVALRQFTSGASLNESTEDARHALPDTEELFGDPKTPDQVIVGYEGDSPRNNWYWIFAGESKALYEHN